MVRTLVSVLATSGLLLTASCHSGEESDPGACAVSVDHVTQSGKTLTTTGSVKNGFPTLSLSGSGGQLYTLHGTASSDGSTVTYDLSSVPAGQYTATWNMSCSDQTQSPQVTTNVHSITVS